MNRFLLIGITNIVGLVDCKLQVCTEVIQNVVWPGLSRHNETKLQRLLSLLFHEAFKLLTAFASLIWKSLYRSLPPRGTLLENIWTDMRQTALPFIRNLSTLGEGRLWERQVHSTQEQTSALLHRLGSLGNFGSLTEPRLTFLRGLRTIRLRGSAGERGYISSSEQLPCWGGRANQGTSREPPGLDCGVEAGELWL